MRKNENRICFHEYADIEVVQGECNHSFPIHIHETLCIVLITGGRAKFSMNGHKDALLSVGDYYVIPPYTPHALSSVALEKFNYRVICFKNSITGKRFDSIVSEAKAYIKTCTSKFCIGSLSETVHISKYHLGRIFKEQVGITPYQFYIGVKVKKVRQRLQARLPLSDIVFNLHFFDQNHLCNTFRKHIGISPMQYAHSYQYN